jgi:hypothetical protein
VTFDLAKFLSFCQVSILAAKLKLGTGPAKFKFGCQVFWSQYVFPEFLPLRLPSLNLVAKFQTWQPSSNLAAKLKN